MNIHIRISSHYSSWPSPHGNQDVARQITNKLLAIWFNWDPTFFRKMDGSLQQKKKRRRLRRICLPGDAFYSAEPSFQGGYESISRHGHYLCWGTQGYKTSAKSLSVRDPDVDTTVHATLLPVPVTRFRSKYLAQGMAIKVKQAISQIKIALEPHLHKIQELQAWAIYSFLRTTTARLLVTFLESKRPARYSQ